MKFICPYVGQSVMFAISSNDWIPKDMEYHDGLYYYDDELQNGTYEYKYIIDGEWKHDTTKPFVSDNFGGFNNIIRIHDEHVITIVHISDTHSLFHDTIPDCDILIHSGDFSIDGHPGEYEQFNNWLGKQKIPYKIVILGNHDLDHMMRDEHVDPLIESKKRLSNAIVLNSQFVEIEGIKIYGIPWFWFNTWNFGYKDIRYEDTEDFTIPNDTDILVTHAPPFGMLDSQSGSKKLFSEIALKNPKFHLFGHIHEMYGCKKILWSNNKTTYCINSSSVQQDSSRIINRPTVIKIFV